LETGSWLAYKSSQAEQRAFEDATSGAKVPVEASIEESSAMTTEQTNASTITAACARGGTPRGKRKAASAIDMRKAAPQANLNGAPAFNADLSSWSFRKPDPNVNNKAIGGFLSL